MSGTDTTHVTVRCALFGTDIVRYPVLRKAAVRYAMSGTDVCYAATHALCDLWYSHGSYCSVVLALGSYVPAMQCPVLRWALLLSSVWY
eukprot:63294-Rhodomonas_salina.3